MLTEPFNLEPHPSGKNTCFILTSTNSGVKLFVKFPRTVDDSGQGIEEIYAELLGEKILIALEASCLSSHIEVISLKVAIVREYCDKNWSDGTREHLEIANYNEWPLLLTAETLMRQTDRSPDKHEHVGLRVVDGIGRRYKAVPLDLGHAFIGFPGGYNGLDEDLTSDWINSLFWAHRELTRAELEETISKVEKLQITKITYQVAEEILKVSNWPSSVIDHLWRHVDKVGYFLMVRQKKIRATLLNWWDQKHVTSRIEATVATLPPQ